MGEQRPAIKCSHPEGTHIIFIPSLLAGISHIAPPKTPGGAGIHSLSYVQGGEETGNISGH